MASGLLETTCAQQSARLLLLTGGPCTVGPGQIAGASYSETIRSHLDIEKETPNAQWSKPAIKYFTSLAERAVHAGFSIDVFACSLDQVGLYEMRVMPDRSGGIVVMSDSFR